MATNQISTYLKYANLQMASEGLFGENNDVGSPITTAKAPDLVNTDFLVVGNNHTSKFTTVLKDQLIAGGWQVIAHQPNTSTGFSGTLFKNNQTGELVVSFRSTEFIDDAVRDNQATNKMEIKEHGWAFGQIADMEAWWAQLKADGKVAGAVTVTGYSLGGHLATAFNLLHSTEVAATYTFNGAGVGDMTGTKTLAEVMADFQRMRLNADGQQIVFADSGIQAAYDQFKTRLNAGDRPTQADLTLL